MSSNAFARLEREYNERENAVEMAKAERERIGVCRAIGPHQDGEQSPQLARDKWNRWNC